MNKASTRKTEYRDQALKKFGLIDPNFALGFSYEDLTITTGSEDRDSW